MFADFTDHDHTHSLDRNWSSHWLSNQLLDRLVTVGCGGAVEARTFRTLASPGFGYLSDQTVIVTSLPLLILPPTSTPLHTLKSTIARRQETWPLIEPSECKIPYLIASRPSTNEHHHTNAQQNGRLPILQHATGSTTPRQAVPLHHPRLRRRNNHHSRHQIHSPHPGLRKRNRWSDLCLRDGRRRRRSPGFPLPQPCSRRLHVHKGAFEGLGWRPVQDPRPRRFLLCPA